MAVRFDDNLNNEIKRTFKNFNAKHVYNKYKTRGKGMLPREVTAQRFKDKYSDKSRAEVLKQLKLYQSFGSRDALNKANENSRISKWELSMFRANKDKTRKFYENEIADLERIIGDDTGKHLRLNEHLINLQRKLKYLDKDLETLTEREINTMRTIYNYAERSELVKEQGFRLYLSQLERTMSNLGYSEEEINSLLNKFNVLSENEFLEMTRNEDLIDAVYDLIDSPKGRGKYELMTDEDRARGIITDIQNHADELVAKYKTTK